MSNEQPIIEISDHERSHSSITQINYDTGIRLFRDNGCLQIKNALSKDLVKEMRDHFQDKYSRYFTDKEHDDALLVGDKRHMITIQFESVFNNPELYVNPFIMPILIEFLSLKCILGSMGAVVSLPNAEQQEIHRDHPDLFDGSEVDCALPGFAITVIVPLVETNEQVGTTRFWKKSHTHKNRNTIQISKELEYFDPYCTFGDVLLMDYRLTHSGLANKSDSVRPILYNIYSRAWFRDFVNYNKQRHIEISASEYEAVPDDFKGLFVTSLE